MPGHNVPHLFLICDQPVLRQAYGKLLRKSSEIKLVNSDNYEVTARSIPRQLTDVILIDSSVWGDQGLDVCRRLRDDFPDLCIILISVNKRLNFGAGEPVSSDGYLYMKSNEVTVKKLTESILAVVDD